MKKLVVLFAALVIFCSACSTEALRDIVDSGRTSPIENDEYAFEGEAEKFTADTTFCNGYLGFSYTIPTGWWLYNVNADNFSAAPAATANEDTLDIIFGDGQYYIDMSYFGNLQYSSRDNHIGIDISAEKLDDVNTLDDYMAGYVAYMLEPYGGYTYTLLEEDQAEIQGRLFELRIFEVGQEDRPYRMISYTCEVNGGYYLTLLGNYWPDNKNALENINKNIETGLVFL